MTASYGRLGCGGFSGHRCIYCKGLYETIATENKYHILISANYINDLCSQRDGQTHNEVILPRASATATPVETACPGALGAPSPFLRLRHLARGGDGRRVPRRLMGRLSHGLIRCLNEHGTNFRCCIKQRESERQEKRLFLIFLIMKPRNHK